MNPKPAIPVLLLLLASPGCRSAVPAAPPVAVEEPTPEELRIYAVADILEHLDRVPLQGCCVMPEPTTQMVSFSPALEWALSDGSLGLNAEERLRIAVTLERIRDWERARDEERQGWGPEHSRQFRGSEGALLDHIESRLAVAQGGPMPCTLGMKEGFALVARGSPEALAVVERALAELR